MLHDYLRNQRSYLLPQSVYADAVKELAGQHGIDVIDLYNSNLLDTHDAQVISTYMPDGVHGNPAGYQVLAEHLARNIIEIVKRDGLEGDAQNPETVSGNGIGADGTGTVSGNGINGGGTVSGNGTNGDGTVSGNGTIGGGTGTVSANGNTGEAGAVAAEKTLTPEEAKRLEEERRRAEQERIRQEREEAARAAENNKKVAEDALVIPPAQENKPAAEDGAANGQAETAPDVSGETAGSGQETGYEYGGEAIVIR